MKDNNQSSTVRVTSHPALVNADDEFDDKPLNLWETVLQAFSLFASLQKKKGFKRATDLLETRPSSVILAGLLTTVIFFTVCLVGSQLALHYMMP